MKELIVWGTLDPVAAFLMSRRYTWTRDEAETVAESYYKEAGNDPNELLNPSKIRDWSVKKFSRGRRSITHQGQIRYQVELLRDFSGKTHMEWRVIPIIIEDSIVWIDLGGFPLAKSRKPHSWNSGDIDTRDFILNNNEKFVVSSSFPSNGISKSAY
jgi:hypothetical protein